MSVLPISPEDVKKNYNPDIPDFLIKAVNKLIQQRFNEASLNCKSITLYFKEVKELMVGAISNYNDEYGACITYKNHYLDIENVYHRAGWQITVDKPGYNESYEGRWIFYRS